MNFASLLSVLWKVVHESQFVFEIEVTNKTFMTVRLVRYALQELI